MASALARTREIVTHDLDPEFLRTVSVDLAWRYDRLYEALKADPTLCPEIGNEEFGRRRGLCAMQALVHGAERHGVPYNFRKLECNGQAKLLLKAGRVVLMQEPMLTLTDNPRFSEYKRELAASNSLIRQLELDLGDQPLRIHDWSGGILGVLLHGASGTRFTREHKALGGLILGVPDAEYQGWTVRIDLHHLAMFGIADPADAGTAEHAADDFVQVDKVNVTPKRKAARRPSE